MSGPIPDYFYHYTSIEHLALILHSQSIRFTRADRVNDLEEISVENRPDIKKSVYISSWTGLEKESLPMWNLYANKSKGIRIKLKTPVFHDSSPQRDASNHPFRKIILNNINDFLHKDKDYQWLDYLFGPQIKVQFVKKIEVSVPGIDDFPVDQKIGIVRFDHWLFENDFRFLTLPGHIGTSETEEREMRKEPYSFPSEVEHLDIKIERELFDQIEITLGPNCGEPERIIVESLIEKFTTHGKVRPSELREKYRL